LVFQNFFTDRTLLRDVRILKPGHFAYVSDSGQMRQVQYWDFNFSGSLNISEQDAIDDTNRLFTQAVQRQLVSDVPVNSYLSGGIDSGAITMIASQFLNDMKTFTIGFDLSSASGLELGFDERQKAEHISYLAKTEHYEMVLKAGDMERCMDKYIRHLEEPRVGQSYPNYYAANLASKFGKVVLSGAGGDELFGGYPWRYYYTDQSIAFENFIDGYYLKWQRLFPEGMLKELLAPISSDVNHINPREIFLSVFPNSLRKEMLDRETCLNMSLYFEAKTFLHGLLVVEDKLSMAHSLETRVPFLDNDLVNFAMQLPTKHKILAKVSKADENDLASKRLANNDGKQVLRKALSRHLNAKITEGGKQGFSSPDASWFRGESIDYVKRELAKLPALFDMGSVNRVFSEHANGQKNNRLAIWSLLYLKKYLTANGLA
jgi:asparagine synthase (glutamine-hydrolysing)